MTPDSSQTQQHITPHPPQNDSKTDSISPPAFLDLADSAARLGSNLPDINARIELKRLEHERQRAAQLLQFEEQMRALEQKQRQELEEAVHATPKVTTPLDHPAASQGKLNGYLGTVITSGLNGNATGGNNPHLVALSAPTTPPLGGHAALFSGANNGSFTPSHTSPSDGTNSLTSASIGATGISGSAITPLSTPGSTSNTNKRKSVNITPSPEIISNPYHTHFANGSGPASAISKPLSGVSGYPGSGVSGGFSNNYGHGARSMPASRRGSSGSKDDAHSPSGLTKLDSFENGGEDSLIAGLAGLSVDGNGRVVTGGVGNGIPSITTANAMRNGLGTGPYSALAGGPGGSSAYLFDDELDNEMQNSLRHLPTTTEDDRFGMRSDPYRRKLSVSSAALDLAPLSQTPPRSSYLASRSSTTSNHLQGGAILNGSASSEWPQFSNGVLPARPLSGTGTRSSLSVALSPGAGLIGSGAMTAGNGTPVLSGTPVLGSTHILPDSDRITPTGITTTNTASAPNAKFISASAANTPSLRSGSGVSPERRGPSPNSAATGAGLGFMGGDGGLVVGARSVPATPLTTVGGGGVPTGGIRNSPGGPGVVDNNAPDSITFGATGELDESFDSSYGFPYGAQQSQFDSSNPMASQQRGPAGSTALYQHGGSRYGLSNGPVGGVNTGRIVSGGSTGFVGAHHPHAGGDKMGGLHGTKHKRGDMEREFNRFAGTRLEDLVGEIASLCKDQHGCRYLQKKLEEGIPEHRDMIFRETFGHFAELMTDPFGNYLCQKLLEYSTDEQRNLICEAVAQELVSISLNMHGTRAVQKMIDFLSTSRQIHSIIVALSLHVVTLIKDLNGNHVVQKCLNKLSSEDNQFIYNAVAAHCVEVATHRHGCCVLQRCIDHASDAQRVQLVTEITYNALTLVQDPYGNYVVQYILDLNDNRFSDAVIRQFIGNVCALSVQKFSSNVIEKCIRVAEQNTRRMLIEELLNRTRLEKLLRDSFGNYCVQTALDYAEPNQRMILVEGIRPILPLIRNTPYGKRIQSKLQREQMEAAHVSHYGGAGPYNNHNALVNLAMANNGIAANPHARTFPHQSVHPGQLSNDLYNPRNSLYSTHSMAPPTGMLNQGHPLGHAMPHSHSIDGGYGHILPGGANGANLINNPGFGGMGTYNAPIAGFGGNVGLTAGLADPYQRTAYPYGI
ncbi:hypothetical protein FRC02_002352 [Tulasnella sp. 418]|nr:hypothetical protein FRC02_002352 [Tulasnella sp. 418]